MNTSHFRRIILLSVICTSTFAMAQEPSLLESLRNRLRAASENQTEEEKAKNRENLNKLMSVIREGAKQIVQSLPEDSQKAIDERRSAWMDSIASGFGDLKGEDIERWMSDSDNVILKSLSRDPDSPSIDARSGIDRLPEQWWYGKQDRNLALLLTQPPETIVRRGDLPGPPVWFVNGIATKKEAAIAMADLIAEKLSRRVHLLHNPTFMEPPNHSGLQAKGYGTDDLSECLHDRLWPASVVNRLEKMDEDELKRMLAEEQILQGNPTTRQLAHVLLTAKQPIDLITHSQGCIIARNAFFTMAMLGYREQCENEIAWIAAGIPLNDKELSPLPKQTTILDVGADPVAKIVGLRGGTREYKGTDHSFADHYLEQIEKSHFWKKATPAQTKL